MCWVMNHVTNKYELVCSRGGMKSRRTRKDECNRARAHVNEIFLTSCVVCGEKTRSSLKECAVPLWGNDRWFACKKNSKPLQFQYWRIAESLWKEDKNLKANVLSLQYTRTSCLASPSGCCSVIVCWESMLSSHALRIYAALYLCAGDICCS